MRSVTHRLAVEVHQDQPRLRAVLEQMPAAVLVVDAADWAVVYANQGTTALMDQLAALTSL